MPAAPGFTLLETIVVLLLLGVTVALAVPAFSERPVEPDPLQRIFSAARRTAVQHAQTLTVSVAADGQWRIDAAADDRTIASGVLTETPPAELIVRVSALGACTVERAARPLRIDPVRCNLITGQSR